ncbi:hypothetical protein AB0E69_40605 [Kribbella sp. NPDC026611]|uniref:hypothetical protein n=1 Tax=Kribbella sp. NPDC026611 TaxID=3154911 RepID=UPI0034059E31
MSSASLLGAVILLIAALTVGTALVRQSRALTKGALPPPGRPAPRDVPDPESLDSITPDQQQAIVTALRAELATAAKAADRKALYANIIFFTAGVLASIVVTLLVHPL